MKNELGIEVKCENCTYKHPSNYRLCDVCLDRDLANFCSSYLSLQARIKELQEQRFTKEELQFIKNRLDECIEEWDVPDMVFMAHQILKKIEQTLKNSEGNLNKQ